MADATAWMPLYWGDYSRDTGNLNALMHGAYLMLIRHYWCTGAPLPDDDDELWRTARCDSLKEWQSIRPKLAKLFVVEAGLWTHKRVEHEIAKARALTEAKAKAGAKGGQKRWQGHSTAMAGASQSHKQTDTHSQSPSPEDPPSPPQAGGPDASQGEGKSEAPSRANGTNPRSIAKTKREAEEAAALAEARLKRDAEDDAKWLPRLTEFQQTGNWPSAWGTPPNPNPAISETGVFLPKRLWPAMAEARAQRSLVTELPDNLRRTA